MKEFLPIAIFLFTVCISLGEDRPVRRNLPDNLGSPIGDPIAQELNDAGVESVSVNTDDQGNKRVDFKKKDGTTGTLVPYESRRIDKYYRYYSDGLPDFPGPTLLTTDEDLARDCHEKKLNLDDATRCLRALEPLEDVEKVEGRCKVGNSVQCKEWEKLPGPPTIYFEGEGFKKLSSYSNDYMAYYIDYERDFNLKYRPEPEIKRLPQEGSPAEETCDTIGTDRIVSAIDRLREETGLNDEKMLNVLHRMRSSAEEFHTTNTKFLKTLASAKTGNDLWEERLKEERAKKEKPSEKIEKSQSSNDNPDNKGEDELTLDYGKGWADEIISTAKTFAADANPFPFDPSIDRIDSANEGDVPTVDNDFWVIKVPSLGAMPSWKLDLNITHYPKVMALVKFLHNILVFLITGLFLRWVFSEIFEIYKVVFSTRQLSVPRERLTPFKSVKGALSIFKKIKVIGSFLYVGVVIGVVTVVVGHLAVISTFLSVEGVNGINIFSQLKAVLFQTTGVLAQSVWLLCTVFPFVHLLVVLGNAFMFLLSRNTLTPIIGWAFSLLLR